MVVMEYLDPATFHHGSGCDIGLEKDVRNAVEILHNHSFVHSNLRDCNMMCMEKGGAWRVLLLDFDWAGRTREAQYPVGLNHKTVCQPAGVCGGGLFKCKTIITRLTFFFPLAV